MKLSARRAKNLTVRILTGHGYSRADALIVADVLVEAELRGRATHGLLRVPGIVERKGSGRRRKARIVKQSSSHAHIDGNGELGYLVAHRCAEVAIRKAKSNGLALVGARNTTHTGMLGYYVSMAAKEGLIAIAFSNCSPMVAPWGGTEKVFGTNPMALAFPGRPPIIIDMSTSATTMGEILKAKRTGGRLKEGTAIDKRGKPTRSPDRAREGAILPFGEHKGYGLSLAVQLLSGAFVGAAPIPQPGTDYGFLYLAMARDLFASRRHYRKGVTEVIDRIKASRKAGGSTEILIPGERAHRDRQKRLKEGIDVDEELMRELEELESV